MRVLIGAALLTFAGARRMGVTLHAADQLNSTYEHLQEVFEKEDALDEAQENQDDVWWGEEKYDGEGYWYTHQGDWDFLGIVNDKYIQEFKLKEDRRFLRTKKYKAWLSEEKDANTLQTVKTIKRKVFEEENYFWTLQGMADLRFDQRYIQDQYVMFHPQVVNRYWTWRVAAKNDPTIILFTIQKRLWNDHCRGWFWKCKTILKIYVGPKGDKSTLIYYGVGDTQSMDEPDFKFYHTRLDYLNDKSKWVAKIDHKDQSSDDEDEYKIKVMPGEDAALMLVAATCLDRIADRVPDHDTELTEQANRD